MNMITLECNADNYRDIVRFQVPSIWLKRQVGDVKEYQENALYSDNDDIFMTASKDNVIGNFKEIKIIGD